MTNFSILNAVKYFSGEKHQIKAWEALWASLDDATKQAFISQYRRLQDASDKFPLDAPYFWQRDSKTGHGERMCFSSAMAMALDYLDPEVIEGDDD